MSKPTIETIEPPARWEYVSEKAVRLAKGTTRSFGRVVQSRKAEHRQGQADSREAEVALTTFIANRDAKDADLVAKGYAIDDDSLDEGIRGEHHRRRRSDMLKKALGVQAERVADAEKQHAAKQAAYIATIPPFINEMHETWFRQARETIANLQETFTELLVADIVCRELLGVQFTPPRGVEAPIDFRNSLKVFNAAIPEQMRPEDFHLEYFRPEAERRARMIISNITGAEDDE
jgi:hypothetical protein